VVDRALPVANGAVLASEESAWGVVFISMKWIGVILLVILGALATYCAIEYFTVAIHALPSYIPGHEALGPHGHPPKGHLRKRGAVAAVIAVVAFVLAGILAYRIVKTDKVTPAPDPSVGATV